MNKSNIALAAVCGFLFGVGWWLIVDAASWADVHGHGAGPFWIYVPGILATIGLFLMSNPPATMFQKDSSEEHSCLQKLILLVSVMCKAVAVITGVTSQRRRTELTGTPPGAALAQLSRQS
jgi:hypothetical protein